MIYTVTCNPSLDYVVHMEGLRLGAVNRCHSEELLYGGKGINVSAVLKNLGVESVALGFVAGFTGDEIEKGVRALGCRTDFIRTTTGFSRINVKLKSEEETEINGAGPSLTAADAQRLLEKLDALRDGDILVLAGSIPATLPENIYEVIMKRLSGKHIRVVVDATRALLRDVLKYRPFLIKPNHHELGELFGRELKTQEELISCARELQEEGAQNVLISMAGDGAILLGQDGKAQRLPAPKGRVVNSTGAGDSMVAGFLAGYLKKGDLREAFRMSIAAGSASAFSKRLATKTEIERLLESIEQ